MTDLVALWLDYAQRNKLDAALRKIAGDAFGEALSLARADVRTNAAELLSASATAADAAKEMHRRAVTFWQRDLPLVGFDAAAIDYTKARIWQNCAQAIDPELPEIQPKLEWE
jgi:hypothetical protein